MKVLRLGQSLCSSNAPSGASFKNLYSLDFDGVDDYLDCGDSNVLTPNDSGANRGFSISLWLNLSATGNQRIISKSGYFTAGSRRYEYEVRTQFATKAKFIIYGNQLSTINQTLTIDTTLSASTWYHIVFTFDLGSTSSSIVGYLDGVQKTHGSGATYTSAGTWSAIANTAAPLLFAREGNLSNYGNCKIDEVALFDDELSSGTVTSIYNSGTPTDLSSESYLLGYWRNGDPNGTAAFPTITDDSTNSNNGTMTNMASGDIVTDVP